MMNEPSLGAPAIASQNARRFPTTRVVLGLLLVGALLATGALMRSRARAASEAAAAAARAASDRGIIPVLTATAVRRDVPIWLEGLGSVSAFYTVTVRTLVDGRIDKVFFTEGQRVHKGDPLIEIDERPFVIQLQSAQAALERDQAQLKNAQLNADRYKTLTAQNLIATQQYTDQQALVAQLDGQVRSDQAQIGAAKLNIDYARITSRIDGVVGIRLVDPGNVVHPTDVSGLVVVTQLEPIVVFLTLPEDDLGAVQKAMTAGDLVVEARDRDGRTLLGVGKLAVIDNEINQATATIRLKAVFDNHEQRLWPNQFVKARVKVGTAQSAIVVPLATIQHGPQGTFAYVVGADSTAQMRPVTVEASQGESAIVSKGLAPGDEVVVEGQAQLRPGSRIATRPAAAPGASANDAPAHAPATP
jgi:multidrug efflux system membrane fusion protein